MIEFKFNINGENKSTGLDYEKWQQYNKWYDEHPLNNICIGDFKLS